MSNTEHFNLILKSPDQVPLLESLEPYHEYLVNHKCQGWTVCRIMWEGSKFLYFYEHCGSDIDLKDIDSWSVLPPCGPLG